ncbi:MAG: hypothetical protein JSU09_03590 [Bacteroidetes bacterium]|nr:hypothetical protein [Bacteroidota bacterium]
MKKNEKEWVFLSHDEGWAVRASCSLVKNTNEDEDEFCGGEERIGYTTWVGKLNNR